MEHEISAPLSGKVVKSLRAGDTVRISGTVYTARDAAHKRMIALLEAGGRLPFDVRDQIIYYVGPCPASPGHVIGPAGPTTSGRMDAYTPPLIERGLAAMIGKGLRDQTVVDAMRRYGAVYLAAVGGAAALLSKKIVSAQVIAFPDLGPEAVRKLVVEDFPAIVAIDSYGGSCYENGKRRWRQE